MQTAHALRLVEPARARVRRRRAAPVRRLRVVETKTAGPGRQTRTARQGWLKPLVMAVILIGEWLVLIAEVFVRVYVTC